jgi:lipopolysaccharide transport system permease protein
VIRAWAPLRLSDLGELWEFRDLLAILAWRDVSVRYRQTALGVLWALLQPALQTLLFTVLFRQMAWRPAEGRPFALFVLPGVVIWGLFSGGISHASDSLVANANLVSKVYFPRLILPLASLFVSLIDFAFAASLLAVCLVYYRVAPTWQLLLVVPLALQTLLAAAGAGLFLAVLNVRFRDVRYALPFLTQVLMYATPVFYATRQLPSGVRPFFELNPLAPLIDGFRAAVFGDPMPYRRLGGSLALSLGLVALGFLYFKRFERDLADQI